MLKKKNLSFPELKPVFLVSFLWSQLDLCHILILLEVKFESIIENVNVLSGRDPWGRDDLLLFKEHLLFIKNRIF